MILYLPIVILVLTIIILQILYKLQVFDINYTVNEVTKEEGI